MKRTIYIYGLISGIVFSLNILLMCYLVINKPEFQGNMIIGYTVQVVMFSLIFFGVRSYRNKQLDGVISFGKAFKMGALMALVASTLYVVTWLICYYLFIPDFMERYTSFALENMAKQGKSAKDIAKATKDMEQYKEWYKNPLFVILLTYAEVLPVGLVVSLISALILKRRTPLKMNPAGI